LAAWQADPNRTTYVCDVRVPEEYVKGHWPGSLSTQGGQLVQETDHTAAVRGARFALIDPLGVRANMSASWLAQMGWEVAVLDDVTEADLTEIGPEQRERPVADVSWVSAEQLDGWLQTEGTWVIDLGTAAQYIKGHIPGALGLLRSTLLADLQLALRMRATPPIRCVLTCADGVASGYAQADVQDTLRQLQVPASVHVLSQGNAGWKKANQALSTGTDGWLAQRIDRYRRPYEGTSNAQAAMQAYLDWEFGLVEQLKRDGTHHFAVI
jgi:rhodanese-related sulfurtransferase